MLKPLLDVVPPRRLEHPTQGLGIPCSIHLSYGGFVVMYPFIIFSSSNKIALRFYETSRKRDSNKKSSKIRLKVFAQFTVFGGVFP